MGERTEGLTNERTNGPMDETRIPMFYNKIIHRILMFNLNNRKSLGKRFDAAGHLRRLGNYSRFDRSQTREI